MKRSRIHISKYHASILGLSRISLKENTAYSIINSGYWIIDIGYSVREHVIWLFKLTSNSETIDRLHDRFETVKVR
jgi:hypothetical protein